MIFTRRWYLLFALGVIPILLSTYGPGWMGLTLVWDGLLLAATLADFLILPSPTSFTMEREVEDCISLGEKTTVRLSVRNPFPRSWRILVKDEPPIGIDHDFGDTEITIRNGTRHTLSYALSPRSRGDFKFGNHWLRVAGALGLVCKQARISAEKSVKVYPNIQETARFTLMARRGKLQQAGIRAARLAGAGREFESLRDYMPDDEYRRIDWKATAKRGRLTSRQFEVERSQNVILVIDAGRTMLAEVDGIAKMDYAINAALLLAYVASLSDDHTGLLVFADAVQSWIPPRKGRGQVYRILDALYNTHARRSEPDYSGAFSYLNARWRRRSLVVCFTDLWDPDSSRQTMVELASLQPRHLVACVTASDLYATRVAEKPIGKASDAYEKAVALQVKADRDRSVAELKGRGVLVVDTPADKLSAALVNRYLEVKERSML